MFRSACPSDLASRTTTLVFSLENEAKKKKAGFFGMPLVTLGASLLESMLAGKGVVRGGDRFVRAGEGIIRAVEGQDF